MFSNNYPGKAVHFLRINYTKNENKKQSHDHEGTRGLAPLSILGQPPRL